MPASWIGLTIALLAVVPGFIASATWSRARTWKGPSGDVRTILQSLALSAAIQVAISPLTVIWIVPVHDDLARHPWRLVVWSFMGILALPVVLGVAAARTTDRLRNRRAPPGRTRRVLAAFLVAPTAPSPWDSLFTAAVPDGKFVLVEFTDGTRVGGTFGAGSIALTSPEQHGVFLTQEWLIDETGAFTAPRPDTLGLLIPHTDAVRLVRVLER